ncbi:MAG: universal stress protein [Deltaproteobacteria bacterium]|nr:universal stress protein [Deltaproteobacteria bacterium]
MKKILLIITPGRQSTEALHYALHKAKETKGTLKVVYIIDREMTQDLQNNLAEIGFIGDRPGEELSDALNKEYHARGKKVLEEVEKQARTFQVPVESELKTGSYLDICEEEVRKETPTLLVATEKKDSFLKKVFEGSETKRLKDRVSCELKVYQS